MKAKLQSGFDRLLKRSQVAAGWREEIQTLAVRTQEVNQGLICFDFEPATEADHRLRRALGYLRPWTGSSLELVRYGGLHDGGYVMAMDPAPTCALSLGVGNDISWETDMSNLGASVAMFDPTVDGPPRRLQSARFHRLGLGPTDSGDYRTLATLMGLADLPEDGVAFLKMDVEGAEWEALHATPLDKLGQFAQITLELHGIRGLADPERGTFMLEALSRLSSRFYPIHLHANNFGVPYRYGNYWMSGPLEVSYIRKDFLVDAIPATSIRHDLDRPCHPGLPDIDLSPILQIEALTGP